MAYAYRPLWIHLSLEDTDRIHALRDRIADYLDIDAYSPATHAHLTLHRGFSFPDVCIDDLDEIVQSAGLVGQSVPITGLTVWPSKNNPLVIMLDVDLDVTGEQLALDALISRFGGIPFSEHAPPHITLLQAGRGDAPTAWPGLSDEEHQRVTDALTMFNGAWETEITDVNVDVYDPPELSN